MTTVASTPFAVSKDLQRPNSPGKMKFVCRWGGELVQDSQGRLAFEGGETRLCTLPKAVRYRDFVTKLRELTGQPGAPGTEMVLKYQLPGHNMEELISLRTNEDLEEFKDEHDDLASNFTQGSPAQRLRLFVLPSSPSRTRQGSTTSDAAGDALASKEPSAFLNHHKLRTSQSERELPALIPSHTPEGGSSHPFTGSRSFSTGMASHVASAAMHAVGLNSSKAGPHAAESGGPEHGLVRRGANAASLQRDPSDGAAHSTADETRESEPGNWVASQRFTPSGFVSAAFPGRTASSVGRPGAARGSSSPHGLGGITHASTLPRDPMRASAIMEHQHEADGSSSGSEKEHNSFGASSSDSEDEARVQMQSSSRRPSYTSNYRPEFAAKTLAQVKAMLGGPKGKEAVALSDDETIEKCLNEVEAALTAGLNFKGKFNSGLQVIAGTEAPAVELKTTAAASAISPSQEGMSPGTAVAAPVKRKVHIVLPEPSPRLPAGAGRGAGTLTGGHATPGKMPPRLMVGSGMATGEWTGSGKWQEVQEAAMEIPPSLQQIESNDLTKIKELGRGQFGSVWLCRWLGVEVAVKELHATNSVQSNAEMFGEAETLNSLRHPCIIAFYGVVVNQESPASVLEYVRGSSLRSGLQKLKQYRIPNDRRVRAAIALQAARGMEYLHSRRVVHFDLKCDNLLCDLRDLNRPVVKIGDLGLSKKKAATFVSGNMRGTLPWMAPELFPSMQQEQDPELQEDRVNEKVDVFSFGVVMWEIWTWAEQPYPGLGLPEIFSGVMNGTLRPSKPKDCDPAWSSIMEKCWATQPSKRATFTDVADALDALVAKCDAESQQPPPSPAMLKSSLRNSDGVR
ncbi:hypothetical protein WJX77_007431 [Trebouxia sp. C0004]